MILRRRVFFWFLPALVLLVHPIRAVEKPAVLVQFQLQVYETEFGDVESLNHQVADLFSEELQDKIHFVTFETDSSIETATCFGSGGAVTGSSTNDPQGYRLCIVLKARDPDAGSQLREVGFYMQLAGPEAHEEDASKYWKFRPAVLWGEPVPAESDFLDLIRSRVRTAGNSEIVEGVLEHVSVAKESVVSQVPLGWEPPFKKQELCIDLNSRLKFIHWVVFHDEDPVRKKELQRVWEGKLTEKNSTFCEPIAPGEDLSELFDPSLKSRVSGIYVTHYVYLEDCGEEDEPVSLEAAALDTLGGGS